MTNSESYEETYAQTLTQKRDEKDEFFGTHRQSPIPPEHRDEFDGLAYFEPDPDYNIQATVTRFDDPEELHLETSDERAIRYKRVFEFSFELDDEEFALAGYRQEPDDAIFVPFRDKTTGQQSYKDGRYIELEIDGTLSDGETIEIDFNLAYSPFCAYSDTFSCPLPPEENWLDTMVEAGEKTPPLP
jgi:uncharacterized protein (DUF1684 family)